MNEPVLPPSADLRFPSIDALRAFVPDSQILFGTDYPYISEDVVARERQGFDAYQGFKGEALQAVERGNAMRLFPRLAG